MSTFKLLTFHIIFVGLHTTNIRQCLETFQVMMASSEKIIQTQITHISKVDFYNTLAFKPKIKISPIKQSRMNDKMFPHQLCRSSLAPKHDFRYFQDFLGNLENLVKTRLIWRET